MSNFLPSCNNKSVVLSREKDVSLWLLVLPLVWFHFQLHDVQLGDAFCLKIWSKPMKLDISLLPHNVALEPYLNANLVVRVFHPNAHKY